MEASERRGTAEPPFILALDVGTSSVRASFYDCLGRPVEGLQAGRSHEVRTTAEGGAELEADPLLESLLQCLEVVLWRAGDLASHLAGVAVATFWHSFLGTDAAGRPRTPIYLWADTRSGEQVRQLRRQLDERAVHARTGCLFHTSYLPARLLWLRQTQPDLFHGTARWMSPGEYLFQRLFGEPVCSLSMASGTGLFNQQRMDWDDEVLAAVGVQREQLSPLARATEPVVGLRGEWARRLPALQRVPWFPAWGDGACSNVGCGCVTPDRVALMVGTSGALRVLFPAQPPGLPPPPWGVWRYCLDASRILFGGALSNGGNLVAWMYDTLRLGPPEEVEAALSAMPPDAHGLTLLPFLAGERSPGWASHAVGSIVGLRWHTRPLDLLRAGLEAVACRFALVHQLLEPLLPPDHRIFATGGALLRSPAWLQIMADALGRPVVVAEELEASSRGAALVALEALGALPDLAAAPVTVGPTYRPDPARHDRYRAALVRQQEWYGKLVQSSLNPPSASPQ